MLDTPAHHHGIALTLPPSAERCSSGRYMKGPVECGLDTSGESLVGRGGEWISNMASDVSVMKRNFYVSEAIHAGAPRRETHQAAKPRKGPRWRKLTGARFFELHDLKILVKRVKKYKIQTWRSAGQSATHEGGTAIARINDEHQQLSFELIQVLRLNDVVPCVGLLHLVHQKLGLVQFLA